MTRPFKWVVLILILLLCLSCPAGAQYPQYPQQYPQYPQQYPQQNPQHPQQYSDAQIDAALRWQDQAYRQQLMYMYPRDARYDSYFMRLFPVFNAHLGEVFPNYQEYVEYSVYAGPLGFNAVTFHRLVVFDSILLDGLKRLCEGFITYNGLNNDYTRQLARFAAGIISSRQSGMSTGQYNRYDTNNPFGYPICRDYSQAGSGAVDALFIEMLASWMAHEGAHAYMNHNLERAKATQMIQMSQQNSYNPQMMNQEVQKYINYTLTPQKELEADAKGSELLVRSGISVRGYIVWLSFADMIEELMGSKYQYQRTHPRSEQRIGVIVQVARSLGQKI